MGLNRKLIYSIYDTPTSSMPPSQLKRLKTSLREQGVVGPQKSKKQKKQASKNGALRDSRVQRNAALQGIREQFNPFEVKAPFRSKYEFASSRTVGERVVKGISTRPGTTKGLGEENVCFNLATLIWLTIYRNSAEKLY